MPYIGTFGDLDPDWDRRQSEQMGRSLSLIMGAFQQRNDAKKAAEQEERDRFYTMLGKYPELADLYGREMVEKYGKSDPMLPQVVNAVSSEHREATREQALKAKDERQRRLAFEGMMATAEQLKTGRPDLSYPEQLRLAASMMDPKERTLAESYLRKEIGQTDVPRDFDPLRDVPVGRRALEFPSEVTPETLQATKYGTGLEITPYQKRAQQLQEASQAIREADLDTRRRQVDVSSAREKRLREQAAGEAGETEGTGVKAAKGLGKEISVGLYRDLGKDRTAESLLPMYAALDVEPPKDEGSEIAPLTKTQANLVGNALESRVRGGEISRQEAMEAADAARVLYVALVTKGMDREEAIRKILKKIKAYDADAR